MSWPLSFQHVQPANRVLLEDQDQFKRGFNMSYIANKRLATCAVISAFLFVQVVSGQNSPEPAVPAPNEPAKLLSGQQLDNLVAPIALYPDPLLGEVLAASTYPFEIAEAQQWVQDHPKWKPSKLMNEAKKQNWDPSIQGLVAFPQVLALLSQGVSWTTSLGNAFLAQQSDVMQAVQRLRAQAQAAGKLQSTPQETVTTENRLGQSAVRIEPANPDIWYVPNYILHTFGDRPSTDTTHRFSIQGSILASAGARASILTCISVDGEAGDGAGGDGRPTGMEAPSS